MTTFTSLALCAALVTATAAPVFAQTGNPGDERSGREIAARWCVSCHVIDARNTGTKMDAAPSFPVVANREGQTRDALTAWLGSEHPTMPNFSLARQETADLVAYILSLRKGER